ncbi:MAG: hypothetical protein QNK37_33360 [Acidobacteriota bacterium]|nr:hypothetical protein [Acidobacteriota bacterium]
MLPFLTLLFLAGTDDAQMYRLDEIYTPGVLSTTTAHGKTLFLGVERDGLRPFGVPYLFDYQTQEARQMLDSRYPIAVRSCLQRKETGFLIFDWANWKLLSTDKAGNFQTSISIRSFSDFPDEELRIHGVTPYRDGQFLVSYQHFQGDGSIYLAAVEPKAKAWTLLHVFKAQPNLTPYVAATKGHWWQLITETADVFTLNADFSRQKKLKSSREIEIIYTGKYKKKLIDFARAQGRSYHQQFLKQVYQLDAERLVLREVRYSEETGKPIEWVIYLLEQGTLRKLKNGRAPIGHGAGGYLTFNLEGTFLMVDTLE